jgi:hypothetical protein
MIKSPNAEILFVVVGMSDGILDVGIYAVIGALCFGIGVIAGDLLVARYYNRRFVSVSRRCADEDSLTPLLDELERES